MLLPITLPSPPYLRNIDENGYLKADLNEVANALNVSAEREI